MLARQEVAERQGEHDCRDEQRLDDREASTVERRRLEDVAAQKRQRPGEPGSLPDQSQERRRLGQRDRREVEGAFLLERRRDGEQQRRDKSESGRHSRSLLFAAEGAYAIVICGGAEAEYAS